MAINNGVAVSGSTSWSSTGTHTIDAHYSGDSQYFSSDATTFTETVNAFPANWTLTGLPTNPFIGVIYSCTLVDATGSGYTGNVTIDQNSGTSGNTGFCTVEHSGGGIVCSGGVGGLPENLSMVGGTKTFFIEFIACTTPNYSAGDFALGSIFIWVRNPITGGVCNLNGTGNSGVQVDFQ